MDNIHRKRHVRKNQLGYLSVAIPPIYAELLEITSDDTLDLDLDIREQTINIKKTHLEG